MRKARHRWLYAAAAILFAATSGAGTAKAEDTIKIGVLHSLSGTMAISETILKDLMLMEVAEINAKGGLPRASRMRTSWRTTPRSASPIGKRK